MMKLLLAGLALIALGLALVLFTNLNPALLFIIGIGCSFLAVVRASPQRPDHGSAVSAGSVADAANLAEAGINNPES